MKQESSPLAMVTGAASGIGKAITLRLLSQGMRVVALDRSSDNLTLLQDEVKDVIAVCHDLSDWKGIASLCEELQRKHGAFTYLVNNAGAWPGGALTELPDAVWAVNFDVNLSAPFALMRALCTGMIRAGGGAVVNISSRNAFRSSVKNSAYDASKAGLIALTRTAAGELARHGVRVNAICPGVIATPGDAATIEDKTFKAAYTKLIPMDRYGTPDEIASVALFLLSKESSFITGQAIIVDGGQIACQDNERFMQILNLSSER